MAIAFLQSCGIRPPQVQYEHQWTVEVTYFTGEKATLTKSLISYYDEIELELLHNANHRGCLFIMVANCDNLFGCEIEFYDITSHTFKPITFKTNEK